MDDKQNIKLTENTVAVPIPVASAPKNGLGTNAIVAIVIGSVAALLIISGLVVWAVLTRQSKNPNTVTDYPADSRQNSNGPDMSDLTSVSQHARDTERKTDLDQLSNQLEAYYVKTGGYPTISDINNQTWRSANDFSAGDNHQSLADPLTPDNNVLSAQTPSTATGSYTYKSTPAGCMSASDAKGELINVTNYCTSYTLTALLENKNDSSKDPSSTSTQTFYIKTSVND